MTDTERFAEKALIFARMAAEARNAAEREGFAGVAAGYLRLAKRTTTREVREMADEMAEG
jgi:hypothetical protein